MNQTAFLHTFSEVLAEKGWELKRAEVKELAEAFPEAVLRQLRQKPPAGKNMVAVLPGFGRITLKRQPRRKVRIPFGENAGQMKWVPKKTAVRATIAKKLKDEVAKIK
jgi:nucleoid DNA-binding protein